MKEREAGGCSAMARKITSCYFFEPRPFNKQPKLYEAYKSFSITNNTISAEHIN